VFIRTKEVVNEVYVLTELDRTSISTGSDRFESRISITIRTARPVDGGTRVAVGRSSEECVRLEGGYLSGGEGSDGLSALDGGSTVRQ
jgi:hypothetical protein